MQQPVVCGVYMLFHKHELVYIGRSTNCYRRIDQHRSKGRTFDYALVTACPASDAAWVEEAMIAGMHAKQNRIGERLAHGSKVVVLQSPSAPVALAVGRARSRAASCGISTDIFDAALAAGEIPRFPQNPARTGPGSVWLVQAKALDAWCEAQQKARLAS
jgi:predicted GIY-YIG superfamily endonuclease